MYVEFAGIPGAGKTTLVAEVQKLLEREGMRCATRATFFPQNRKWVYKSLWSLFHPQYLDFSITRLLLRLSRKNGSTFQKLVIQLHEHQKLQYQIAHQRNVVVLWDAGHIQRLSNLAKERILSETTVVNSIWQKLPRETLLVLLDTPVADSVRRMRVREAQLRGETVWKLSDPEERERTEAYAESRRVQKELVDALGKQGFVSITLDGTKPPAENAAIVRESIKKQR